MSYSVPWCVVKIHIPLLPWDGMKVKVPGDVYVVKPLISLLPWNGITYSVPGYVVKIHITLLPWDGMNIKVRGDVYVVKTLISLLPWRNNIFGPWLCSKIPCFIVTMRRNDLSVHGYVVKNLISLLPWDGINYSVPGPSFLSLLQVCGGDGKIVVADKGIDSMIRHFYERYKGENSINLFHRIRETYVGISKEVIQLDKFKWGSLQPRGVKTDYCY